MKRFIYLLSFLLLISLFAFSQPVEHTSDTVIAPSDGMGFGSVCGLTAASVPFADALGCLTEKNANFNFTSATDLFTATNIKALTNFFLLDNNAFYLDTAASKSLLWSTGNSRFEFNGNLWASGTIQAGASIVLNGATDTITASSGLISFDNDALYSMGYLMIYGNDSFLWGNVELGDSSVSNITFTGRVNTNIVPSTNNTRDLGSDTLRWNEVYITGSSLHIGNSGDEGIFGYDTTGNQFTTDDDLSITGSLITSVNVDIGNMGIVHEVGIPISVVANTLQFQAIDVGGVTKFAVTDNSLVTTNLTDMLPNTTQLTITSRNFSTSNGTLQILGWRRQTDTGASLTSAVPVVPTVAFYHSRGAINVSSSVGHPYTIRFTGRSIDYDTQAEVASDTEDIAVTGNGWYQTTKYWEDAPSISIVEASKSATLDIYRVNGWRKKSATITIKGIRVEFTPGSPNWSAQITVDKINTDGSITSIESVTFNQADTPPRAANGQIGQFTDTGYSTQIDDTVKEALRFSITLSNIDTVFTEVSYESQ